MKPSTIPTNSISKCEEFAVRNKKNKKNIRSNLSEDQAMNIITPERVHLFEETLEEFVLIDAEMLGKGISQLKPATWLLDRIPKNTYKDILSVDEDGR